MVKYSSRRCSLDHGYSRDIGAEFEKAAARAAVLAGGAGVPREDRPHLCQFAGTTDLLGYDRHRGQAGPRPWCRSLGSPETAVDRQYRAKKGAPLVEQLKYRRASTSESDHLRHLSSRLALSIARVPDTPYRQEPGHRTLNSDELNKINEDLTTATSSWWPIFERQQGPRPISSDGAWWSKAYSPFLRGRDHSRV